MSYTNPYYGQVAAKVVDDGDNSSDTGHLLGVVEDYDDQDVASGAVTASPVAGKGEGSWKNGTIKEYTEEEEMYLSVGGACGGGKGGKPLKVPPPPSPLHNRPQYKMNTYDSPPGLATAKKEKSGAKSEKERAEYAKVKNGEQSSSKHSGLQPPPRSVKTRSLTSTSDHVDGNDYGNAFSAAEENHYDEVGTQSFIPPPPPPPPSSRPPVPPLPASYDVPGSSRKVSAPTSQDRKKQQKRAGAATSPTTAASSTTLRSNPPHSTSGARHSLTQENEYVDSSPGNVYANFDQEENLYESVENLRAAIEQQRHERGALVSAEAAYDGGNHNDDDDDDSGSETGEASGNAYFADFNREERDEEERYVPFPGDDTYKAMRPREDTYKAMR